MNNSNKEKPKVLLTALISFVIFAIIATAITIIFVNIANKETSPPSTNNSLPNNNDENNSNNNSNNNNNTNTPPTLQVPQSIAVDLLNLNYIFEYHVQNAEGLSISVDVIDPQIATINQNLKIVPHKIGSTKIITTLNSTPKIIKETSLSILDCVKDVSFEVVDQSENVVKTFLTTQTYVLKINQNMVDNFTPTITHSNNVLITTNLTSCSSGYFLKFKLTNAGNFEFNYAGKYIQKTYSNTASLMPTNFDISFSNISPINNVITLYLFNENYTNLANLNNIFKTTAFEILYQENAYDNVVILPITSNIINISQNTITALSVGEQVITFKSQISNISKSYTIKVLRYNLISSLNINSQIKNVGSAEEITLNKNEEFNFEFFALPEFTLNTISINFNNELIEYNSDKLKPLTYTQATVTLVDENSLTLYTLTINVIPDIYYTLDVVDSTHPYIDNNPTFKVLATNNSFITFKISCFYVKDNSPCEKQNYKINSSDQTSSIVDLEEYSGNIALQILSAGKVTIEIIDLSRNIVAKTITIISE